MIHPRIELVISKGLPARNEVISREEALRAPAAAISSFFSMVLDVAASEVIDSVLMFVSMLGLDFVNFNVFFRYDFPDLTLALPDARDNISLMSCIG